MPELATDFQSLPEEYQHLIRLAEQTYKIAVAPLQLLVGGWSGAVVYLVSVSHKDTKRVEHCILKLDRKGKSAKSDEVTRHNALLSKFARDHISELVFDRVEHDGAIAIFYRIAGQSLLKYRRLSNYERQSQLRTIFAETNEDNAADGESLYQLAVNRAREVGAAMVELQGAMRLSRLWQNQGKSEEARELLSAAYSKITEGFATADMKETNALLSTLSS